MKIIIEEIEDKIFIQYISEETRQRTGLIDIDDMPYKIKQIVLSTFETIGRPMVKYFNSIDQYLKH